MTNNELSKKWKDAKENLKKQEKCFHNVFADRKNISDEDFDTYCEEMQGALELEEKYWKKAEGRLY